MTSDKIFAEIKEIQSRIPKNLLKNVVKTVKATPVMKMVMEKALADPNFPEEKKEAIRQLLATGDMDKEVHREDPKIAKMIDNFVNREIKKKIHAGLLPAKIDLTQLKNEQSKDNQEN